MNNEIEEDDNSPEAWLRAAAELGAKIRGEDTLQPVKEERPPLPETMICEAAEAGHYDQRLLTELTKHTTKHTWEECTTALMDGLENGLVENSTGIVRLTEKGQALLDEARKGKGLLHTSAITRIARFLTAEDAKKRAALAQAAKEQRGVNDALERLLASDDEHL